MKKIVSILFAVCLALPLFSQTEKNEIPQPKNPNVNEIMKKVLANIQDPIGVVLDYRMSFKDKVNKISNSSNGKLTIKGDKFHLFSPQMESWYDGKTQWTYNRAAREINITTPSEWDLINISPMFIAKNYKKYYDCTYSRYTISSAHGQYVHCLKLTPKDKNSDIDFINFNVFDEAFVPYLIVFNGKDGSTTHVDLKKMDQKESVDESIFIFNPADHAGVDIIDLR